MSTDSVSQPAARTFSVVDLVAEAVEGRIRIPEFQRPLRWQWQDAQRLFDSIIKGYPIGNLLLWKRHAPAGLVKLGGLEVKSRKFDEGWWVVDGQQRLPILNKTTDFHLLMIYVKKRLFAQESKMKDTLFLFRFFLIFRN
jgi:uncharacterized protein with ParB-like and HNH nuclease domain